MNKNKYLLLGCSLAVFVLLGTAAVRENVFKDWRRIQAGARGDEGSVPVQLRQVVNSPLRTADRCVSCHVSMAPGEQSVRGGAVLTPHPPVVHDPGEIGCTPCHAGQGQATEKADAHGDVHFWPEPMIPLRFSYAGCGRCHSTLGVPARDVLRAAASTFERLDCLACHRTDGRGGTLRPDGGGMEGPDLSRVGRVGYDPRWYDSHLLEAGQGATVAWRGFRPIADEDRLRLSTFLATRVAAPSLVEAKSAFHATGCLGCHKVSGVGGDDGPDLSLAGDKDPGQVSFSQVPGERSIANWQAAHFRAPASVVVGSQMPPVNLDDKDIDRLSMYVLSLRRRELPDVYVPADRVRAAKLGEREFTSDGATLFGAFCSGCHGPDGLGRRLAGVASFPSITNPDFLALASDTFIAATVEHGRPGRRMGAWLRADGLRPAEVAAVVAHVRLLGGVSQEPDPKPVRWVTADPVRGRALFVSSCAGCHGPEGQGGEAPALNNPTLLAAATDTYLVETIARGRRGTIMAGFQDPTPVRPALGRAEIEAVVAYLRTFQGAAR